MKIEIITAIIAVLGVLISVFISFISTKTQLNTENKKINKSTEQEYLKLIIAKRIEIYPIIYFELHEFMRLSYEHYPTLIELKKFENTLSDLNSKYAVFLGVKTADNFYKLRRYITDISIKIKNAKELQIKSEDRNNALRKNIQKVEISLKIDLGIFALEFKDVENNIIKKDDYAEIKENLSAINKNNSH